MQTGRLLTPPNSIGDGMPDLKSSLNSIGKHTEKFSIRSLDFTIACWIRPEEARYSMIAAKDKCGDGSSQFRFELHTSKRVAVFGLGIPEYEPSRLTNKLSKLSRDHNGYASALNTESSLPLKKWSHVAFARKGTMMKLFLNGILESSFEGQKIVDHNNNYKFSIGSRIGQTGQTLCDSFPGEIRATLYLSGLEPSQFMDTMPK